MQHLMIDLLRDGAMFFAAALPSGNVPLASFDAASIDTRARAQLLSYLCDLDPDLRAAIIVARALNADVTLYVTVPALPWEPGIYDVTVTRAGQPRTLRMFMPTGVLPAPVGHATRRDIRQSPPFAAV